MDMLDLTGNAALVAGGAHSIRFVLGVGLAKEDVGIADIMINNA